MEIIIERKYLKSKYTIGDLYIVENGLKNIFLLTFDSSKIKVDVDIDPIDNF